MFLSNFFINIFGILVVRYWKQAPSVDMGFINCFIIPIQCIGEEVKNVLPFYYGFIANIVLLQTIVVSF